MPQIICGINYFYLLAIVITNSLSKLPEVIFNVATPVFITSNLNPSSVTEALKTSSLDDETWNSNSSSAEYNFNPDSIT